VPTLVIRHDTTSGDKMENTALRGFLGNESDAEVRIDVPAGTWIIQRADVERLSDWQEAPSVHGFGRAVQVVVKPGATIGLLTSVTVQPLDRPLALSESGSNLVDSETFTELSQDWGRTHGFGIDEKVAESLSHTTVCCWQEGPSHFECRNDDCGPAV
jgi:hypothetical protein